MTKEQISQQLRTAFNVETFTAKQLWAMTNFAKNARLRCRSNAAYNNMGNQVFPEARFEQVTKTRADNTTYPGLKITVKDEVVSEQEEE